MQCAAARTMTQEDIGRALGFSHETLVKYYSAELAAGKAMTDMIAIDAMMKNIKAGDTALIKFYMSNQLGWKDKVDIESKTNDSEVPLAIREFNQILANALLPRPAQNVPGTVQDRSVLVIDQSPKPTGHG